MIIRCCSVAILDDAFSDSLKILASEFLNLAAHIDPNKLLIGIHQDKYNNN